MKYPAFYSSPDDMRVSVVRMDISGGMNSRINPQNLLENQVSYIRNVDLGIPGRRYKRPGSVEKFSNRTHEDYTVLLVDFDGVDEATTHTATTGQTVTFAGTAQLDTAQKKYGTASLLLDGNSDYVTIPDSDDWSFGTGDFTVDFWVRFSDHSAASNYTFIQQYVDSTHRTGFLLETTNLKFIAVDGTAQGNFTTAWAPDVNTWHHIAFVRRGTTPYIFVDGESLPVTTGSAFGTFPNLAATIDIGRYATASDFFAGWIDEVRIMKGLAAWTSDFDVLTEGYEIVDDSSIEALRSYERQGYTDQLMMVADTTLYASGTEGEWAAVKTDFTAAQTDWGIVSAKESGLAPDDIIIVQNGTDNAFRFQKDSAGDWQAQDLSATAGTGTDSPPKSTVMGWFNNRLWVLKNDLFYYSTPYAADYAVAFDTVADWFRIPVGEERGIVPTRDTGMVIMGKNAIWGLAPSNNPVVEDQPQPLVVDHGVVSKKGWLSAGDDIYYFAQDGFRALRRTLQDKFQAGVSYPLSYVLKDELEKISWANISRLSMVYFDNKIFISVPTSASEFDTWVYYPATQGWTVITGWSPTCFVTHKIGGELRMYYGSHGETVVYRGWYGHTDEGTTTINGTAIEYNEYGRAEDGGQPLIEKVGGELEVEVESSSFDGDFEVSAGKDGEGSVYLGKCNVQTSDIPELPVSLPFFLAGDKTLRYKFPLDVLGTYRTITYQIYNNQANTDEMVVKSVNIVVFPEEYQSQERS